MPNGLLPAPTPPSSARGAWLALTAALLGWMFDGLEMGLFPLVAKPALSELLQTQSSGEVMKWLAVITAVFLIGAATGGVLFGWLGDRLGRVRAMTLSIFTYAIFSGACGLVTDAWQIAVLRFVASLGMGGEWSLGVALVMEVWPNQSRGWLAGIIGAAANCGYMIIAVAGLGLNAILGDLSQFLLNIGVSTALSERLTGHSGWRILMLCSALPAVLTFLIQIFVPESHRWTEEKKSGATSHWEAPDLLGVLVGAAAACGMIYLLAAEEPWLSIPIRIGGCLAAFAVVTFGFLHPIRRYLHRLVLAQNLPGDAGRRENAFTLRRMLIGAGLSGVALLGTWGTTQQAPTWVAELPKTTGDARSYVQILGAAGAIIGCVLAALAGDRFGRRKTYCVLCLFSMLSIFGLFRLNTEYGPMLLVWAFVSGMITASFYGWLPLYLPELFKTRVRATGQGFSFNFGRVLAAIGVMQLKPIRESLGGSYDVACPALSLVYVIGMILIWFAPETKGKPLPDDVAVGEGAPSSPPLSKEGLGG
jgi:MFS transporter, SHS family, sialic acid transporter